MEIAQKLVAVALVSSVNSVDSLQFSVGITLTMAATSLMVQPYLQQQASGMAVLQYVFLRSSAVYLGLGRPSPVSNDKHALYQLFAMVSTLNWGTNRYHDIIYYCKLYCIGFGQDVQIVVSFQLPAIAKSTHKVNALQCWCFICLALAALSFLEVRTRSITFCAVMISRLAQCLPYTISRAISSAEVCLDSVLGYVLQYQLPKQIGKLDHQPATNPTNFDKF